jgi:hypothetical protein
MRNYRKATAFLGRVLVSAFVGLLNLGCASQVFAASPDWKYYGDLPQNKLMQTGRCFYDEAGVKRTQPNFALVWIKCLPSIDLQNAEPSENKAAVLHAIELTQKHYVPPAMKFHPEFSDAEQRIIVWESLATLGHIEPQVRIYNELNCKDELNRRLSFMATIDEKPVHQDAIGPWEHTVPETNMARLHQSICR